jgi:hypothetical protein
VRGHYGRPAGGQITDVEVVDSTAQEVQGHHDTAVRFGDRRSDQNVADGGERLGQHGDHAAGGQPRTWCVLVAALAAALAGMAGTSGLPDLWQAFWIALAALTSGAGALITVGLQKSCGLTRTCQTDRVALLRCFVLVCEGLPAARRVFRLWSRQMR